MDIENNKVFSSLTGDLNKLVSDYKKGEFASLSNSQVFNEKSAERGTW